MLLAITQPAVLDLPIPEGWKAELTFVVGYVWKWFTCLQTVTGPIQLTGCQNVSQRL